MGQHFINQATYTWPLALAQQEPEDKKRKEGFFVNQNLAHEDNKCGSCTFLFFSDSDLSASLYLSLSTSHLLFHSVITVWMRGSFSTRLAAARGRGKRDRESELWGGLADAPCYFSSASHCLCQHLVHSEESQRAQNGLTTASIRGVLSKPLNKMKQEEICGKDKAGH